MSINHWLHELADPWDCVVRDLGEGSVRLICWGSVNANPCYLVRLYGSGRLVVVDQSDLTIAGNPGDPRDNPQGADAHALLKMYERRVEHAVNEWARGGAT